ncbi:vWA domain-containing protein [Polyangium aurulentum]|uniref:vWA domain-containing protein n=1 Tax=Polyangium aurulentum TaxID=2567896 RepID=UPI0010ADCB56|nr:VWA domain-containing protein [Polyangium aurulentum]UQA57117.1 VWA domain-containing protein [Polyangium aurulentum]
MGSFLQARRRHLTLKEASLENAEKAGDLWNAIVGLGRDPPARTFAEAVRDTVPPEHMAFLALDEVGAAYAFDLMWKAGKDVSDGASAFEMRSAAREQWAAFDKKAKQAKHVSDGFGWDLATAWAQVREVETTQGNMDQVERIARLAGRMFASLRGAHATKVHGVSGEVYSVEQGNDVARLLPAETVLLTDPQLEIVALERIASRRAAQYAVRGTTKKSKGPLVLALDESGSMHGIRNEWAKAAAVALARVASEEKRPVAVVHYATSNVVQTVKPNDTAGVVKMILHFLSGGTAIGLALGVAVDQVKALAQKGQRGADIVLVTDGIDRNEEEQKKSVEEASAIGARLWTVAIECSIAEDSPLRNKAAHYTELNDRSMTEGSSINVLAGAA